MRAAVVIVSVALLALAAARCPNSCSGHGDCGGSDKCACWANWQGYDCSERTCEYDVAWATDARQNPHYYAECSGKGICDRTTGLCTCFDGYTGSACRRSVCPNDCSGHGKCRLIAELDEANSAQSLADADADTDGSVHLYSRWDGDKIQACVCDGGFFGPDCSQRYCPKGDDPLTICNAATKQIQTLTLSSSYSTTGRTKQQVALTPAVAGLPIEGTFDITSAGGSSATNVAVSVSAATLATDVGATSSSGSSPTWALTFAASHASLTVDTTNLYSPTGVVTVGGVVGNSGASTVGTLVLTVARTAAASIAVSGTVVISFDSNAHTYTVDLTNGVVAAATFMSTDPTFATFWAASGFAAFSSVVGVAGAHADVGTITITENSAASEDGKTTTAIAGFAANDHGLAYASRPIATVTYLTGGVYSSLTDGTFNGELVLHFTDSEGEVWTTGRIGKSGDATNDFFAGTAGGASLIKNALAAIPNFKIPAVTVASTGADVKPAGSVAHGWAITFDNERNSGTQNLLACDPLPLGCQTAGCSPMYQQPKTWATSVTSPSQWTASHHRVEYARNPVANAFTNAGSWLDSAAGSTTTPGLSWSFATLITGDSIFDNSLLTYDQATVLVRVYKKAYAAAGNWGATATDRHVYYTVEWDYTAQGVFSAAGTLPTTTCGLDGHLCTTHYIPTGYEDTTHSTANGLHDAGVGYNRVPIGNGLYINLGDALAGLSSTGTDHEQLYISFDVATVRCDVTDTSPAPEYEHVECSGRGSCDRTTGTCTCFEGHYGDHCAMQTILV